MRFVAAASAGLLQFLTDQPLVLWPLHFLALVPLWLALASGEKPRHGAWLGLTFAAGSITPLLLVAGAALPVVVAAAAAALQWTSLGWLAARLLRRGPVRGALATAALVTLLELAISHAVPMFGTAQMSVRSLSAAPMLVAFVAYTGTGGLLFVVMALQALLANALRYPGRRGPLVAIVALVGIVAILDVQRWNRPLGPALRVAAVGWGLAPPAYTGDISEVFDTAFAEAADRGARLVVTPETSFWVSADRRQPALDKLGDLAKRHRIAAAFGVWNGAGRDNRIWWFDPNGELRFEYRKTHLVPWLEDYVPGDGTLVEAMLGELRVGGMICQDDNFTDVARGYGSLGVPLLVVPTNDWPEIRAFHLENSIFRSIESGYAVVRAASGGISALVSPRGERVAWVDHIEHGPKVLVADLPTGDGQPTLYACWGDLPIMLGSALLLLAVLRPRSSVLASVALLAVSLPLAPQIGVGVVGDAPGVRLVAASEPLWRPHTMGAPKRGERRFAEARAVPRATYAAAAAGLPHTSPGHSPRPRNPAAAATPAGPPEARPAGMAPRGGCDREHSTRAARRRGPAAGWSRAAVQA